MYTIHPTINYYFILFWGKLEEAKGKKSLPSLTEKKPLFFLSQLSTNNEFSTFQYLKTFHNFVIFTAINLKLSTKEIKEFFNFLKTSNKFVGSAGLGNSLTFKNHRLIFSFTSNLRL